MNKEEILKYAKVFSEAKGDTYKIHFVNENKTINEPDLWKETLNLIDKLQKENDFLKAPSEYASGNTLDKRYVEMNFISKDKIRDKIKELEEIEEQFEFINNNSYVRKRNKDFMLFLKELLGG